MEPESSLIAMMSIPTAHETYAALERITVTEKIKTLSLK
jgi:hypothetical protein